MVDRAAPSGSSRDSAGSRDSGTRKGAASTAKATTGRFTRKTDPHEKCSSSHPPATGPIAIPRPATAAQMPIARARSSAGKTLVRMERVVGMISAPPMPMSARVRISVSALSDMAASSDPVPNTSIPATSARRRPKRSPRLPMVSNRPANTSV